MKAFEYLANVTIHKENNLAGNADASNAHTFFSGGGGVTNTCIWTLCFYAVAYKKI